ncbi:MAG: hypothetical protein GTO18_03520 [Anaerolineales bacterium]|nr:hypothetical protein [Anaerolineales bacterium]
MNVHSMEPASFPDEEDVNFNQQDTERTSLLIEFFTALRLSATKRELYLLILSLSLNMLLIDRLIFTKVTTIEAFFEMTSPVYAYASFLLTFLSAVMFGIAVAKRCVGGRAASVRADWLAWFQIILSGALMILSIGCPFCGSPALSALGLQDGLELFPLGGIELKLVSIFLLGSILRLGSKHEMGVDLASDVTIHNVSAEFNRSRQSLFQRIRLSLLPLGVVIAVLSTPLLPPEWKVDFSNEQVSPSSLIPGEVTEIELSELVEQVLPPEGYRLDVNYGQLGPQLRESGAIDFARFVERYKKGGAPLTDLQQRILTENIDEPIVIDRANAHFLLNFFWALGLTNKNPILENGPMMEYSEGNIGRFASTGGWTLGQKDPTELYSSAKILSLTPGQQALVEKVSAIVYRPCCNNPTIFPDCNHGMAMLGLLELLAANGSTEAEMMEAAKYFNAFWFPQQSIEVATFFQTTKELIFSKVDAELVVGPQIFSGSGFKGLHDWLGENGLLEEAPNQGGSCGV